MCARWPLPENRAAAVLLWANVLACAGCSSEVPKTYPVNGRLELAGASVEHLSGSTIEAALVSDPQVRAAGSIKADGSFQLESRHHGQRLRGAQAGAYQVRIILADDDREKQRKAGQALAPRFLDFKTSNLTIDVPANSPVVLQVASQ